RADRAWCQYRQRHPRRLSRLRYAGRDLGGDGGRDRHPCLAAASEGGAAMNTLIFRTLAPLIVGTMLVFSIYVCLRGHNEPGGGFIGGLIAAASMAVFGMASGVAEVRRALRVDPMAIAGSGVVLAGASGL